MRSIYMGKFKSLIYEEREALKVFKKLTDLLGEPKPINYE
ncbi:TPA: histidine kinase [Bacillus cereus]|nr:histidine kinase [Bacillus cereus]